ncbi:MULTISPECIES: hypothetical protein [Thalassospira]|uniref:hypothetical protein n=1 Tax=Thalassospira TaxID=168934 RepID=UPI001113A650|nr:MULTISPECIES: hypothetical protein [Thalassospira]MDM7975838.1 hypothetical protein [Thalassospira xiamenensis]
MDVYENIVIGGFIYTLGFCAGRRALPPPTNINLLQQTPMDQSLADVLIGMPNVYHLIEFKRRASRSQKETDKRRFLERYLSVHDRRFCNISRATHLYIENDLRSGSLEVFCAPYLDFVTGLKKTTLDLIANTILDGVQVTDLRISGKECCDYLELVQQAYKGMYKASGSAGDSGGFIIVGGASTGEIQFQALPDIRQFAMTGRELQRLHQDQRRDLDQKIDTSKTRSRVNERERSQDRTISRGLSM